MPLTTAVPTAKQVGSLIPRLPLLSLDFGFANSNFGPHPDTPDPVFPVTPACHSRLLSHPFLHSVIPSFSSLCLPPLPTDECCELFPSRG